MVLSTLERSLRAEIRAHHRLNDRGRREKGGAMLPAHEHVPI